MPNKVRIKSEMLTATNNGVAASSQISLFFRKIGISAPLDKGL